MTGSCRLAAAAAAAAAQTVNVLRLTASVRQVRCSCCANYVVSSADAARTCPRALKSGSALQRPIDVLWRTSRDRDIIFMNRYERQPVRKRMNDQSKSAQCSRHCVVILRRMKKD